MNRLEVKTAIVESGAKAKQNRKDYFERKECNRHWDHRNHRLKVNTRALHIVYAYITYKQFKSCEKYNYKLDVVNMAKERFEDRSMNQAVAINEAKEILGFVEQYKMPTTRSLWPLTRKVILPNEEFDNWVMGIARPMVLEVVAA